jgi:hypothetical protein
MIILIGTNTSGTHFVDGGKNSIMHSVTSLLSLEFDKEY